MCAAGPKLAQCGMCLHAAMLVNQTLERVSNWMETRFNQTRARRCSRELLSVCHLIKTTQLPEKSKELPPRLSNEGRRYDGGWGR